MSFLDELIERMEKDAEDSDRVKDLLEEALALRDSLSQDASEEEVAEQVRHLLESHAARMKQESGEEGDPEYMARTTAMVDGEFARMGIPCMKEELRSDVTRYRLLVTRNGVRLTVTVIVEDLPKRFRFSALLPYTGEPALELLICHEIAKLNTKVICGRYEYDTEDGEIRFENNMNFADLFNERQFVASFLSTIETAADKKNCEILRKVTTGHFRIAEREELTEKVAALLKELTEH